MRGRIGCRTTDAQALLADAYDAFVAVLADVDEDASWQPTGARGWAVRDLTHHCLCDARRALVALHTPTDEAPDRDAVTYWSDWAPDPHGTANGRRHTRVEASMFLVWTRACHSILAVASVVRCVLLAWRRSVGGPWPVE